MNKAMKKYLYLMAALIISGASQVLASHDRLPQRASKIIGQDVRNLNDEKIGKVEDLVVNLTSSGNAYAILSIGGFLGVGDQLIVVPMSHLQYQHEPNRFVLNVDRAALKDAPVYDRKNVPNWNDTEWNRKLESYYGLTNSHNLKHYRDNPRHDGLGTTTTREPLPNKGTVRTDAELTRAVRDELYQSNISTLANQVQVSSQNGVITLMGEVQSETARLEIINKVKQVTGSKLVVDQLIVARK